MSYVDKGMQIATQAALLSDCPTYRVGAALMNGNQMVSKGRNHFKKSHTQSKTIYNGIHAEFNCLYGLDPSKCRGRSLFVVRLTPTGVKSMARPCVGCLSLLRKYGVRVFYYTDYNGKVIREVANGRRGC